MTPAEALAAIENLDKFGMDLGLERIRACMEVLGSPQDRYPTVHVGGTNGKGSTAATLAAILSANGQRTGLFTSPPLEFFGERMRMDGQLLPEVEVPALYQLVCEAGRRDPRAAGLTQFELITAMAFAYFARSRVDVAIVEVGLGGRLDSTNVITPDLAVITNVGLEHAEHLGPTLSAIAAEKGGIIKPGVPVVTGARGEAGAVLRDAARDRDAPFYALGEDFHAQVAEDGRVTYRGLRWHWQGLQPALAGPHQVANLALALAATELLQERGWAIDEAGVREGIRATRWPGRLESCGREPVVLLDGAHNPQAAQALGAALRSDFRYRRLWLIVGVLGDKDARSILSELVPLSDQLILTASTSRRALPARELEEVAATLSHCRYRLTDSVDVAIDQALREAAVEDLICITGSLTTVGEARGHLRTLGRVS